MKRITRIICSLAALLMSLGTVPAADAALKAFSPATTFGGMPTWYQDQNGVSVKPCLEVGCGLFAEPGIFDPAQAISFGPAGALFPTANFPTEWFYFSAQSDFFTLGSNTADILFALEFTTVDPAGRVGVPSNTTGAVVAPFQRLRFTVTPPVPAGIFTIQTPWGTTQFDSNFDCRTLTARCQMTRDTPLPGAIPPDFAAVLGASIVAPDSAITTFLKSTSAPAGSLGDAATPTLVTGGTLRNNVVVTGPGLVTGTVSSFVITGKLFGMEVTPNPFDFLGALVTAPATNSATSPQTFTVTNPDTVNTMTLAAAPGGLVLGGANSADFAIVTDTCSGQTLPVAGGSCTFMVSFAPKPITPTEVAVRKATITINGTINSATPSPAPPGLVNLSGTAQYLTDVSAGANGSISPIGAALAKNAGAAVAYTVTPNAKFQVMDILVDGAAKPFTKPTNPTQPVNFVAPPLTGNQTVSATFMPSGNLTGSGTLGVNDALKALKIAIGLQTPTAEDMLAMDVAPLGADGRPAGDGRQDLKDILLILRRALGVVSW